LLISERFKQPNLDNILLYILDDNVSEGFDIIAQRKNELDALVIGRNELAKWTKLNNKKVEVPKVLRKSNDGDEEEYKRDYESIKVVNLPPMVSRVSECKFCFSKEVCSLCAISIEENVERKPPAG
jgi:hypothetical protein